MFCKALIDVRWHLREKLYRFYEHKSCFRESASPKVIELELVVIVDGGKLLLADLHVKEFSESGIADTSIWSLLWGRGWYSPFV